MDDNTVLERGARYKRGHLQDHEDATATLAQLRINFDQVHVLTNVVEACTDPDIDGFVDLCEFWYPVKEQVR